VFNATRQISNDTTAKPFSGQSSMPLANKAQGDNAAPASRLKKPLMIHDDMDLADLDDLDLDQELARLEQEEQRTQELTSEFSLLPTAAQPNLSWQNDVQDADDDTPSLDDWSDELLAQEPVAPLSSNRTEEIKATPSIEQPSPAPTSYDTHHSRPKTPLSEIIIAPPSDYLPHLADEPLRLDWRPKKSPWKRWLGWTLLNSLALLLLLSQYTYNNFAELARQDSTRLWLEKACVLIDCQLPSKVDVQQIKSSNLLVRSHPEFSGALLVDAIIYNRASFSQPFPLLEIAFSDLNGTPLARRLFKPQEYLGGELAGQKNMPPQTPIHIALEILEPSGGAVNYSLDFISPD
jgi:hypothetical protein